MIVNFAIENNYISPIRGFHGLMPSSGQIDYRETSVAETNEVILPNTGVVRTAACETFERRGERRRIWGNSCGVVYA
jgi:hypothetical protein